MLLGNLPIERPIVGGRPDGDHRVDPGSPGTFERGGQFTFLRKDRKVRVRID